MHRPFPFLTFLCLLLFQACTDPVEPVFQFETGFLLVEGRIADEPGLSEVRVSRNEIQFGAYVLNPVPGVTVECVADDGGVTTWFPVGSTGLHRAPEGWQAEAGRSYSLRMTTPDGEIIASEPERIPRKVPFVNPRVAFEQEAYFSLPRDRFIPAFRLLVDIPDPGGEENYYEYDYTTFEQIGICASCRRSRWRNGECIAGPDTRFVDRWDYLCDGQCWVRNVGEGTRVFSDEFSDGQTITGFEAGRVDYDRPGGLLFQVRQFNISKAAFEFGSVLRDLADGAGGLNAPLPAALVGNLTDQSNMNTPVLGFVGAAAVTEDRVYVVKESFGGQSLPFDPSIRLEPVVPNPPAAPCEGANRTRTRPEGWPE